eukprot:gene6818-7034_t
MKVFLDIDIGDAAKYERDLAAYNRALEFLHTCGSQYGLPSSLTEFDAEGLQLLQESYASDPNWSSKGDLLVHQPPALRAGRIVAELFDKEVPKTAENFKCLCTGEKGLGKSSKKPLHYKGSKFHRIELEAGDGSGGDSIYNGKFNDEKGGLKLKHDAAGILSMANSGKNSNSSQFFFTLGPAPQCDGKHVVFGKVLEGLEILTRIDKEAAGANGVPKVDVTIAECGVL